ncbi:MAG: glucose 1-dehydrogenase [Actinomycetota bacterium]|nr:glucose 1-dehydrogenase [Actinomycetota bacterium]
MSTLEAKVAIVTGAAKGIGAAVVSLLQERGARVCGVDLEKADADLAVEGDVSESRTSEEAVAAATSEFGRLDILVNSAGIQRYGNVIDTPTDEWDRVIDVNLKSMFLTAKHAMPHLIDSGAGAIVNVASVQGFAAQRGVVAYSASKGGVIALTRAIAVDHAPAVRANCVCPGSVDTPMLRSAADLFGEGNPERALKEWGEMHPMGRVAHPREIAEAVAFLASPQSSFITGVALLADGGLLSVISGT